MLALTIDEVVAFAYHPFVQSSPDLAPIPPELSDQYHRARRQFALFSALLLMWALVGVEIDQTPLANVNVKLLNPEVVPLLLAILVIYFWYRTVVEWFQCVVERRQVLASRIDITVANALGAISLIVPIVQKLLEFRLADLWTKLGVAAWIATFFYFAGFTGILGSVGLTSSSVNLDATIVRRDGESGAEITVRQFYGFVASGGLVEVMVASGIVIWLENTLVSALALTALGSAVAAAACWYWIMHYRLEISLRQAVGVLKFYLR